MSKATEKKTQQSVVRQMFSRREAWSPSAPAREEIERRAYEIYLARGATDGHALEDCVQAERELHENAVH